MRKPLTVRLYRRFGKRVLDIVLSLAGLWVLSPIACLVSLLVTYKLGSPSTYCQYRLGLQGRRFLLHKFRTMKNATDSEGSPLPTDSA